MKDPGNSNRAPRARGSRLITVRGDNTSTATAPQDTKATPTAVFELTGIVHTAAKGNTPWAIAEGHLNNPPRYPQLAHVSQIGNPNLIYTEQGVRIIKRVRC